MYIKKELKNKFLIILFVIALGVAGLYFIMVV